MPKPLPTDLPDAEVVADPALERPRRRAYSAEYKLSILARADACRHGELGALLRAEGLHSSHLSDWRRALAGAGPEALAKSAPGPAPKLTAEQRELQALRRDKARLERKLEIAEGCIELQKKLGRLLDRASNGNDS